MFLNEAVFFEESAEAEGQPTVHINERFMININSSTPANI